MLRLSRPRTASSWCFWVSLTVLVGLIVMTVGSPFVLLTGSEGAASVLWTVFQVGFAVVGATFVLGVACSLLETRTGTRNPTGNDPEGGST